MPVLAVAILLVQIAFAAHAVRSGRGYFWLGIIMFVPLAGCLAYFVIEVLPELRHSQAAKEAVRDVQALIDPERDYRAAAERFAASDTVATRRDLAEHCVALKRYDEAIRLYEGALAGLYEHDPAMLLGLAQTHFQAGDPARAVDTLDRLRAHNPGFPSTAGHLLYARALDDAGRIEAAASEYEALAAYYPGEEPRARLALLMLRQGEVERARDLFREVVRRTDRAPRHYFRSERAWYGLAKEHLPG